jgi:hypothetical protein
MEQDQHDAGADNGKQQKNQGSGPVHRLPFLPWGVRRGRPL